MSRAQLKPLTDIVELDRQSSVDIDPAFMKPEDFCDARNGGGQKYDVKKMEVERMQPFVEEKKKLRKDFEEVKVEAVELEEEKKFVMQDARLGLGPMTDCPVDVQLRWANLRARAHHVRGPKKSPRKIVLKRMIMRKAEEAQRKTTLSVKRKRSI